MHITFTRTDLLNCLRDAVGLVSKRSGTLDILNHCLVVLSPNQSGGSPWLTVTATNLEMYSRNRFQVAPVEDSEYADTASAITLPTGLVYDVLNSMVDPELTLLCADGHSIIITGTTAEYKFLGLPSEEYPVFPIEDEIGMFDIESSILVQALRVASIAAGEPARPVLNAVFFEVDSSDHQMRLVATDTHRLTYKCAMLEEQAFEDDWNAIVSKRAIQELLKQLPDSLQLVNVSRTKDMINFKWGEAMLSANLVNGTYPAWRSIIPGREKITNKLVFDTASIKLALKRISIMAKEDSYKACFEVNAAERLLLVHGESSRLGVGDEAIELLSEHRLIDAETGEELPDQSDEGKITNTTFKLNSRYITDVLNSMHDDMVIVELTGDYGPVIIRGAEDPTFVYIVMPVRD